MEPKMRPEQAGFRPNKSCADHINTLRIIVEESIEFRSPLQLVFIDFQQAFDTLEHEAIWKALKEKGVPKKIVSIIQTIYDQSTCNVLHKNQVSEPTYSAEWSLTGLRSFTLDVQCHSRL